MQDNRTDFSQKLQAVLDTRLTPANIDVFLTKVLDALIAVLASIVEGYQKEQLATNVPAAQLEDMACKYFSLYSITSILTTIDSKITALQEIEAVIRAKLVTLTSVHTPSDDLDIARGSGTGFKPEHTLRSRLKTILYILSQDYNCDLDLVTLTAGTNLDSIMRQESYVTVEISELSRAIEVNDEIGNRTFVFDLEQLSLNNMTLATLRNLTKLEKRAWLSNHPGCGVSLIETKTWRNDISALLDPETELTEVEDDQASSIQQSKTNDTLVQVACGELDPYRGFWTDSHGKHWGAVYTLAKRLGLDNHKSLKKTLLASSLPSRDGEINGTNGQPIKKAYCLEEVVALDAVKALIKKGNPEHLTRSNILLGGFFLFILLCKNPKAGNKYVACF